MKNLFITFATLALLTITGWAQAPATEKRVLTLDEAGKIIETVKTAARKLNAPGAAIAVVDEGGNLVALERLDGTFAAGANLSIGKARTAALFKLPTKSLDELIKSGKVSTAGPLDSLFTPIAGGIPITIDGRIIGGVGVSGAANATQDEELANAGVSTLTTARAGTPVTYFDKDRMAAAFAKGVVLFDAGERYKIHASRRDQAGEAEVHAADTDIFYILEGSATFVTGGELIGGRTIAAGEIRGPEVKGGEAHRLSKGEVIIVPPGTPHWFKEVPGPFIYYVVKVR
ncbi:MAG TPA: heme-binding protein [Blastocatellia bacterium]|nr:heme-binding protein [Blastocatellia bacterium]